MTIEVSILVLPGLLALVIIAFAVGFFMGERHGVRMTLEVAKPRWEQLLKDLAQQQDENDGLYCASAILAKKLDRAQWDDPEVQRALAVIDRHRLHLSKLVEEAAQDAMKPLTHREQAALDALGTPREVAQRIAKQYREEHPDPLPEGWEKRGGVNPPPTGPRPDNPPPPQKRQP